MRSFLPLVSCFVLIPPFFLDCVVAVGKRAVVLDMNGRPVIENGVPKLRWEAVASGFLYGHATGEKDQKGEPLYTTFLVTNRHVFTSMNSAVLRFNPSGNAPAKEYDAPFRDEAGKPMWFEPDTRGNDGNPLDLGVIHIQVSKLRADGIPAPFFGSDKHVFTVAQAHEAGVSEGDGTFVLGFPMGLAGEDRNFVVVRQGAIARMSDALAHRGTELLLDTFIFPGNSGGPAVVRPEIVSIGDIKPNEKAALIGVVSGFKPYQDVAVSPKF
ncbi:MAG: serine protease, partial [Acidobacteria bacterium]|nr:serine protease [Acidobacteriota bacterium]